MSSWNPLKPQWEVSDRTCAPRQVGEGAARSPPPRCALLVFTAGKGEHCFSSPEASLCSNRGIVPIFCCIFGLVASAISNRELPCCNQHPPGRTPPWLTQSALALRHSPSEQRRNCSFCPVCLKLSLPALLAAESLPSLNLALNLPFLFSL